MGKKGRGRGKGQVIVEATDIDTFNANYDKMKQNNNNNQKNQQKSAAAEEDLAASQSQIIDCDVMLDKTL